MFNPTPKAFLLKITKKDGTVQSITTRKKRRISETIQAADNSEVLDYSLRVTYSFINDNYGKKIAPTNEGFYKTKPELMLAWRCFMEK